MLDGITNDPRLVLTAIAMLVGGMSLCILIGTWFYVTWLRYRKKRYVYQLNFHFNENNKTEAPRAHFSGDLYYQNKPGFDFQNWKGTTHISALWDASEKSLQENFRKQSLAATLALLRTMPPTSRLRILNTLKLNKGIRDRLLAELGM